MFQQPNLCQFITITSASAISRFNYRPTYFAVNYVQLFIEAEDGGQPPLQTQTPLTVTITDVNDNAPMIVVSITYKNKKSSKQRNKN